MPFFWNDETYWERYKESFQLFKLLIPLLLASCCFWLFLFKDDYPAKDLFLLSGVSGLTVFAFINIFKQYPNAGIPDDYPQWGKNLMYIGQFLVGAIVFYLLFLNIFGE